ncbi:PKD domain-containing protein [Ekhidna sp.]
MKHLLILFLISLAFSGYSQIPRSSITSNDDIIVQTAKPDSLPNANASGYLEYLPANYEDHNEELPLIVFLHGQGERGNGNTELYKTAHLGIPNFIEDNLDLCYDVDGVEKCFIVISPQLSKSVGSWGAGVVNAVIDFAITKYRVDTDRIYLAGHSLGGIGVYKYASTTDSKYNHELAAIVPVAANGISTDEQGCRVSARKINVRAYHSRDDQSRVKFPGGEASFNRIKNCVDPVPTADLQFVAYDGLSHNGTPQRAFSPTDIQNGLNVYEWLLSHTLGDSSDSTINQPPIANAGTDVTISLPQDSIVLVGAGNDPDGGPVTFEWRQVAGTAATLSGTDSEDLTVSNLTAGSFSFAFEVTDEHGLMDADTMEVIVLSESDALLGQVNEKVTDKKNVRYLEYLPPSYDSSAEYPVLIYFHSKDVAGDNLDMIKQEGPMYHITQEKKDFCFTIDGNQECFIVISPQVEAGSGFFRGKVNAIYDQILSDYNRPGRVYLTGFDEGGTAIYSRLLDPENSVNRYAGVAVVGAKPATTTNSAQNIGLLDLKILIGHGTNDDDRSSTEALDYYNGIRSTMTTSDTLFASYQGANHEQSLQTAFDPTNNGSIYEWLFGDNSVILLPPVADAGSDIEITLPQDSLIISGMGDDLDGSIAGYAWTQISGPSLTLFGATSSSLTLTGLQAGFFEFSFKVIDSDGLMDTDTMTVTIQSESLIGQITEKITDKKSVPYVEYLPQGYDPALTYPVLIYLPSEDVEGYSLGLVYNEGPLYHITQEGKNFCFDVDGVNQCFIVITPQTAAGSGFFRGKVNALYDQIEKDYNEEGIYITGFDEGASAIYARVLDPENNPNRYAGIGIVGARASTLPNISQNIGLLNPKILIGHSDADEEHSYTNVLNLYNDIAANTATGETSFVNYIGESHNQSLISAFDPASPTSIYAWLFNSMEETNLAGSSFSSDGNDLIDSLGSKGNESRVVNYMFDRNYSLDLFRGIEIEQDEVVIHNQLGQRVLHSKNLRNITSQLQNLKNGIYLYYYVRNGTGELYQYGRIVIK